MTPTCTQTHTHISPQPCPCFPLLVSPPMRTHNAYTLGANPRWAPAGWGGAGGTVITRVCPVGPQCFSPGRWTDGLQPRPPWAAVHEKASSEPRAAWCRPTSASFRQGRVCPQWPERPLWLNVSSWTLHLPPACCSQLLEEAAPGWWSPQPRNSLPGLCLFSPQTTSSSPSPQESLFLRTRKPSLASCTCCAVRGLSLALPSPPEPGEPIPPHTPPAEPPAHLLCASRGRALPTPATALVLVLGKLSCERPEDLSSRVTAPGRPLLTPRRAQVPPPHEKSSWNPVVLPFVKAVALRSYVIICTIWLKTVSPMRQRPCLQGPHNIPRAWQSRCLVSGAGRKEGRTLFWCFIPPRRRRTLRTTPGIRLRGHLEGQWVFQAQGRMAWSCEGGGQCGHVDKAGVVEAALAECVWRRPGRGLQRPAWPSHLLGWCPGVGTQRSIHPNVYRQWSRVHPGRPPSPLGKTDALLLWGEQSDERSFWYCSRKSSGRKDSR